MATNDDLQSFLQQHCIEKSGEIDLTLLFNHPRWRKEVSDFVDMIREYCRRRDFFIVSRIVGVGKSGITLKDSLLASTELSHVTGYFCYGVSFEEVWDEFNRPTTGKLSGWRKLQFGESDMHAILVIGIADQGDDIIRAATAARAAGMEVTHVFAVLSSETCANALAPHGLQLNALDKLPKPQQAAA